MDKNQRKYAGSDWVERDLGKSLSPLGRDVADILGELFFGIYHLDTGALNKVDWANERYMSIVLRKSLSTFDFDDLTRLVFLAHWFCVRVTLEGKSFNYIEILFHRRIREGAFSLRHPTLSEAMDAFIVQMAGSNIRQFLDPVEEKPKVEDQPMPK